MQATINKGSCLCGRVRYEVDGELAAPHLCHCSRCRKAHGSAFTAAVAVKTKDFRIVAGEDTLGDYAHEGVHRWFCRNCGSPLFATRDAMLNMMRLRIAALDTPYDKKPVAHIYATSKAHWYDILDGAPQYEQRPLY
ncbi:MAG: GFA family protein [Rhodanobacter sp.]|jgi:hypothetical protein|nr:GFA family protein [Rhodanobacter sp.]